jgi:putative oxidoreductase
VIEGLEMNAMSPTVQEEITMSSFQRYIVVFSRVLVAMIFLLNGLGIINQAVAARELIEHGAPANLVPFLMLGARTLEVVAGLSLALGIYPQVAAVALLVFLIPATFVAHQFWQLAGTASFSLQLLNFSKNTAMMGGLLLIAATQFQPTLLLHTLQSDDRERTKNESASRDSTRVA